jgi:hypothetical protein
MPSSEIPTKTQRELDGVQVRDVGGRLKKLTGEKLRLMTTDVVAAIADQFGGEKIATLLAELCEAESLTNGGNRRPDHRTRLAAVTLVLAYLVGRPVERQEIIQVNLDADASEGLMARLKSSPALRSSLKKLLAEVEDAEAAGPVVDAVEQPDNHNM